MGSIRVQLTLVLLSFTAGCCLAQEFNSRLQSFPNGAGSTKPNLRAALQRLIHNKPLPHPDVLANNGEADSESSESFELGPGASDSAAYSLRSALLPNGADFRDPSAAEESNVQDILKESGADNTEGLDESESTTASVSTMSSRSEEPEPYEAEAPTARFEDKNVAEGAPVEGRGVEEKTRSGPAQAFGVKAEQEKAPKLRNQNLCGSPAESPERSESQSPGNLPPDQLGASARSGQSTSQLRRLWEGRNPPGLVGSQPNYFDQLMPYNPYFPGYQAPYWPNLVYPQFAPGCSRALDTAGFGAHPSDPSQSYYSHVYPYLSYPGVYPYLHGRTDLE